MSLIVLLQLSQAVRHVMTIFTPQHVLLIRRSLRKIYAASEQKKRLRRCTAKRREKESEMFV